MDVIPAIWCPKSRVDAASQFVNRSLKKQPVDAKFGVNINNRDGTLFNGGSCREDIGCSNDNCSFEVSPECEPEVKNNGLHSLQNSIVKCSERTCDNKQRVQGSQGNSNFTDSRLSRKFETDRYKDINKVPSYSCPSSKNHFTASNSDSPVHCGCYVCLHSSAESSNADACSSVRRIQEELKDIKREVENLHSSHLCDGGFQDMSMEAFGKRRRRPRRRGRGNWQYGADYKASIDEVKEKNYLHNCHQDKKLPISLNRPYRVNDGSERDKVGFFAFCFLASELIQVLETYKH